VVAGPAPAESDPPLLRRGTATPRSRGLIAEPTLPRVARPAGVPTGGDRPRDGRGLKEEVNDGASMP